MKYLHNSQVRILVIMGLNMYFPSGLEVGVHPCLHYEEDDRIEIENEVHNCHPSSSLRNCHTSLSSSSISHQLKPTQRFHIQVSPLEYTLGSYKTSSLYYSPRNKCKFSLQTTNTTRKSAAH